MSPFCSPSPPTVPFKFKRKSSSASTSTCMDRYMFGLGNAAPYSSLPSLAPLHTTGRDERVEWQDGYVDDLDQHGKVGDVTRPWLCRTDPLSYAHQPLPSLMTKFAAQTLRSNTPLSHTPLPFSYSHQTAYFYPQGDSAIADDGEEYDLESMDIHIRETYFATSAERGRWLSSPVAPRVRSQAILPMRGHSSPVKTLTDASPLRERVPRHQTSRSFGERISTSSSDDRDEDVRFSSSLPPSSPITSPISNLSFLSDCEGDSVDGPHSNSDDFHSLIGTPELSVSSTTCTSPVEPTRMPTPHEVSATVEVHHSTDDPRRLASSSRHTSPYSSMPIDDHVLASRITDSELDDILSPLSQFELDLPEAEPLKLPLSDTVNKPHPGQRSISPGVNLEVARSQDGAPFTQSLSINLNHKPLGSSGSGNKAKRRSATGNPGARSLSSNAKKRRGTESHSSNHSEPPSKKPRLSQCRVDFESRAAKSLLRRGGIAKTKRLSRSPPPHPVEGCDSESPRPLDRKIPKPTRRAQPPQPASSVSATPVATHSVDTEFHATLTGMLIETLATSRATSMDASAMYLVLTRTHPHITTERSKGELLVDIAAVLEAGRTRCGMFEKVDGSGERSRHKALESRWFYVPERDEDPERSSLISAIMPRQKRSETKKYKQYYYRPLDKMSRWDPEDAP